MRQTQIKKVLVPSSFKESDGVARCCNCHAVVSPGRCYRGKVLKGFRKIERTKHHTHIVRYASGESSAYDSIERYKLEVPDYITGYLCDGPECAANYHTVLWQRKDGSCERIPIVQTNPLPELTVRDETEGKRNYKGFNTRVTR